MNNVEARIKQIDSRVSKLEKINDEWMAKHGEMNNGIYTLIQSLMDEREELKRKL